MDIRQYVRNCRFCCKVLPGSVGVELSGTHQPVVGLPPEFLDKEELWHFACEAIVI